VRYYRRTSECFSLKEGVRRWKLGVLEFWENAVQWRYSRFGNDVIGSNSAFPAINKLRIFSRIVWFDSRRLHQISVLFSIAYRVTHFILCLFVLNAQNKSSINIVPL